MKEPKPFAMPHSLLNQVSECSDGGVVVCWIDQEGQVNLYHTAENEAKFLALVTHLTHFTSAVHTVSTDLIAGEMIGDNEDEEKTEE